MNISDFRIGLDFACGPFMWRCTDIGMRTVTAIRLVEDDPFWYQGPPYMVEEVVLDETDLEDAYPNHDAQIRATVNDLADGHPGYPSEILPRLMREKVSGERYPRRRLLRFDRIRTDGELLHPYGARRQAGEDSPWIIRLYLPFTQEWAEMEEGQFRILPLSTPMAVRARASRDRPRD
ncbi:hypothetical protein [Caballeronia sp. LZ016]|uniref:hypothetical protein n=1 Tax=Caballeronia sp. LZ016 TaxID=3038554 RepID=UPI0028631EA4|nr:hypothetical protein [Caballeronia sp. LZ016]MDR5740026.1 hypothetical protein [Caballeronia sp. LZ016]